MIDPDLLREDGLLTREVILAASCEEDVCSVAFGELFVRREALLKVACANGYTRDEVAVSKFVDENADWLPDYALYMAVKEHFNQRPFTEWPDDDIRLRKPEAMARYREELSETVRYHIYTQYLFSRQWNALRAYCNERGISILGDIPIYVALDSSDVWANPSLFELDGDCRPTHVAGVPPDYFSATGQLWGNPLYHWERMKEDGYAWWMRRIDSSSRRFDMLRIDHFRGFAEYWRVPYGEDTAVTGEWREGPGLAFIDALKARFPDYPIIAEDLGLLSPGVQELLAYSGYPGMKVLQFAFDSLGPSPYQPHTYTPPLRVLYRHARQQHCRGLVPRGRPGGGGVCDGIFRAQHAGRAALGYAARRHGLGGGAVCGADAGLSGAGRGCAHEYAEQSVWQLDVAACAGRSGRGTGQADRADDRDV